MWSGKTKATQGFEIFATRVVVVCDKSSGERAAFRRFDAKKREMIFHISRHADCLIRLGKLGVAIREGSEIGFWFQSFFVKDKALLKKRTRLTVKSQQHADVLARIFKINGT